jgi:plastocyanin
MALGTAALLLAVSPASADTFRVDIKDFTFTPDPIVIDVGDRVTWTNRGDETHTVTADDGSFDGEDVDPEQTYSKTFRQAGRFPYRCTRHSDMTGVVDVGDHTGSAPGPPPGTPATTSTTTGLQPATTPAAEQAPVTTSPSPPAVSDPATTTTTLPPTAPMPVPRSSTTSTSSPPAADERVTIPTGEAPVFTPTPEELVAPEAAGGGSSANGPGGRVGDASGGADDPSWALLVAPGVGAAGLGGFLLARRTRRQGSR